MADTPRRKARKTAPHTDRVLALTSDEIERRLARSEDDLELRDYLGGELYDELKQKLRKPAARKLSLAARGADRKSVV